MPACPLVMFPDARLRLCAAPVTVFGREVEELARDIADTMGVVGAIGLTAPHIGIQRRVVVVRLEPGADAETFVNPTLTWASREVASREEGSVSMPGVREIVERPARIRMAYQAVSGERAEAEADGLLAATIQHEIDQIDGCFWTFRLSRLKRDRIEKRFRKLINQEAGR